MIVAHCTKCSCRENIDLLDGKEGGGFPGDFELLECIACYGPDWAPCGDVEISESVCADLQPFYAVWRVVDRSRA
jgi:hypothetical protein